MSQGCFYLLPATDNPGFLEQLVCQLTTDYYRQGQGVFIYTQDQTQAEALDEQLWQQPADSFVAHNLLGEGPRQGSPVIISWQSPQQKRPILINLAAQAPAFAGRFNQVIDFVPADDAGKQQARERFKIYRQAGVALSTAPAPSLLQDE